MPLLVEDGTGVANANSYIDVAALRTYATDRGIRFPDVPAGNATDPAIAIFTPHLIISCDYLETLSGLWAGWPLFPGKQTLSFPRRGIHLRDYELPPIPIALKNAQAQLVLEMLRGVILTPTQAANGIGALPDGPDGPITQTDAGFVTVQKLDVIETHYSETIGTQSRPIMPMVDAWLRPLLYNTSRFPTCVRI